MSAPWIQGALPVGLAAFAYRDLLLFQPTANLSEELQAWLMLPGQTSSTIVLALAAWLLYRRWPRLRALAPRAGPAWLTGLLLAGGLGLYAWATYASAVDLLVPSLVLNALAVANLYAGRRALRVVALPVGFLIFAMPLPGPLLNHVVWHFQIWTADLTGLLLYLIGRPAYVSGDQILHGTNVFSIIEGCSGLRSVETLAMLALLMADLFRRRGGHAALLLLAAPPLAFALNAVRCVALILNPLSELAAVHSAQGIAILLAGVLLLFVLDGLLGRLLPAPRSVPRRGERAPGGLSPARAALAAGAFGAAGVLSLTLPAWEREPGGSPALADVSTIGGWQGTSIMDREYQQFLGRVGFQQSALRRYRRGPHVVDLFVGLSDHRNRQRAPHSPKTVLPGSGWLVEEARTQALQCAGRAVEARVMRSGTRRVLAYHWREGMLGLAGESLRYLLAIDQSPLHRSRHAWVVRVTTHLGAPTPRNRLAAEERLETFCEALRGFLLPAGTNGKDFQHFPDL